MNNGEYVGPLISRTSPRWRMQEFRSQYQGISAASVSFQPYLHEPYIPPSVSAVMITATAGTNNSAGSQQPGGASCHNIVVPIRDKRLFIEFTVTNPSVWIWVVSEQSIHAATGNRLAASMADHALFLAAGGGVILPQALAYSRSGTPYITCNSNTSAPFMNGVISGGTAGGWAQSLIDPRLRRGALGTDFTPGNIFYPVLIQGAVGNGSVTSGTGGTGSIGSQTISPSYIRLEYMV